jgi:hypothetical protein
MMNSGGRKGGAQYDAYRLSRLIYLASRLHGIVFLYIRVYAKPF